jgi:hypothetical protein
MGQERRRDLSGKQDASYGGWERLHCPADDANDEPFEEAACLCERWHALPGAKPRKEDGSREPRGDPIPEDRTRKLSDYGVRD